MKVKVRYEKTQYFTAEAELDDDALLKYINYDADEGKESATLEAAREDLGPLFWEMVQDFVDENAEASHPSWLSEQDAGPAQIDVDHVEEL